MHRRTLAGPGVAVLLLLAACASGSDSAETAGSSTTASGPETAGIASGEPDPATPVVVVNVSVRDGKVAPKPRRVDVKLGGNVRLQVTSDEDDVLHVHGFEVEEPLEAGRTTTVELTADQPGVFEVETHESELELLQLAVR
jgi:plastocyanin